MTEQRLWEATMYTDEAKVALRCFTLGGLGMMRSSFTFFCLCLHPRVGFKWSAGSASLSTAGLVLEVQITTQ